MEETREVLGDSGENNGKGPAESGIEAGEQKRAQSEKMAPYDPEQYWKQKWESKQNGESTEYHNCIFVRGEDLNNIVFNSGEIDGNISQKVGGAVHGFEKVCFRKIEDLKAFMDTYSMDDYVSVFLTVLILQIVPISYMYSIAGSLTRQIGADKTGADTEKRTKKLLPLEDVLDILGAMKVSAIVKNETGEMEIQCIRLKEPGLMPRTAAVIWENYLEIREGLILWLLEISKAREYRQLLLYQITEAVADLAALDFAYARSFIISQFVHNESKDSFYFLRAILRRSLKSERSRKNADTLLCHWCNLDNNAFLWKIALSLVDEDTYYSFSGYLYKRLSSIIKSEISRGTAVESTSVRYLFKEETEIPFQILQENRAASVLYLEAVAEQFEACCTRRERLRFGYYFVMLMWKDYIVEGYPSYRSLFIDSVNQKRVGKRMGLLLRYIWQIQTFREKIVEPIMGMYIKEYQAKQVSWHYMKKFLQILAFTGREIDYRHTLGMLQRISRRSGSRIAEEMQDYLTELLNKR